MINGQVMELALGVPIIIEGFADGKARYCHPFTLGKLTICNLYLSNFNHEELYENFKDKNSTKAMLSFFREAFKPETEEETNELLHAITNDNFAEIVRDIKMVSGISDPTKGEVDIHKTTNSIDWNVAVNSIPVYTSTPHHKVQDLTLTQFQTTLQLIGKKINFEYKLGTISLVKSPDKHISESEHPLYSEPKNENRVMTMKEAMKIFSI